MSSFAFAFGDPFGGDDDVVAPLELIDPVPGNRGLRGPATILLHLAEPDGVLPSDASENLADLQVDAGTTMPASVSSWTGRGRAFVSADSTALIADDLADHDTLLQRDMTVQAILSFDVPDGDSDSRVLIARGIDGSAAQYRSFALAFARSGGDVSVAWEWQDSAGVSKPQGSAEFTHLGAGKFFLFTATRRWEATDKVVVRYYVDERLIGETESVDGDIGGGTTGTTTLGGRKSGGVWSELFDGVVDDLAVYDFEMSPAEVRAVWRRLYEHQPGGVETLKGLSPPGAPWFKDPSNRIGKRMKAVGQALGGAVANIEELRDMFLPDRSPSSQTARWEGIYQVAARPRDSLDRRRERLLAITARDEGFSHPSILAALVDLLDVADASDLEIIEGQNVIEDSFATLEDERWTRGDLGTWSIVAGANLDIPAASDLRWETNAWGAHMRTSIDIGELRMPNLVQIKLGAATLPASSGVGILLANRRTNSGIWCGVYNDAGTMKIAHRRVLAGIAGAVTFVENAAALPIWLRVIKHPLPDTVPAFTYRFAWSYTGTAPADFDVADRTNVNSAMADADWVGVGVFGTASSTASDIDVDVDDFLAFAEDGAWPHYWYVYRNPALGGSPDLVGAQRLIDRIKPAHTHAAVITSKSLLAGNAYDGRAGRGPMGVLHSP